MSRSGSPRASRSADAATGSRGSTRDRSRDPPSGPRGFRDARPYVTGAVVALLTVLLSVGLARNERRQLRASLEVEADTHAAAIEGQLRLRLDALERMSARWEARGGTPREEWEADAALYVDHDPAFEAIEWLSPDLGVRWIVSERRPATGPSLAAGPHGLAALERAAETGALVVSDPIDLGGGETGLAAVSPLRLDGLPGGFVVAVFATERLFATIAPDPLDTRHLVAVLHDDRELFRQAPIEEGQARWAADRSVSVGENALTIRTWPTRERVGEAVTPLPIVVLGLGLVTSILLTLALRSSDLHRARTAEIRLSHRALGNQIEERRRAVLELERTRDTLTSIVDGAAEGIMAVDAGGRVVLWNPAADRLLARPADIARPAEGIRAYRSDGVTELPHEELPIVRAFHGESVDDFVLRTRDEDQPGGRWIAMSARPLRDRDGTPHGAVGVFRDVTEGLRAEAALERAKEERLRSATELADARAELERSKDELEQFARVASHDLQEPLRTVASFTQLLADRYRGKLGAEGDEFIGFIVGGALRMQRQIRDLLAYSRLQSRGRPPGRTDLDAVLDSALDRLSELIDESGAEIERRPLPTVVGDYSQLVLALQSLIENAVKFSRDSTPHPVVRIGAGWDEEEAVVWVSDNGIGLDPRFADRIFEIFQRVGDREAHEGTGIGLAICKRVVERHGGRIWVESKPGEGARFVFTLRVADRSDGADSTREAAAMPLADGATAR